MTLPRALARSREDERSEGGHLDVAFGDGAFAGTDTISLFCETDHPTVAAIAPAPQLTAVFVPTQY
jgi:hypothetical protein